MCISCRERVYSRKVREMLLSYEWTSVSSLIRPSISVTGDADFKLGVTDSNAY